MLEAILAGEANAHVLAELARGRRRAKLPLLRQALDGRVHAQRRILLRHVLVQIDFLAAQLLELTGEIDAALAPFTDAVALLETLPWVGHSAAAAIVAEIGSEMACFPSAKHLASWAGVCPGNKQKAEWRQTPQRQPPPWQPLGAGHLGRSRLVACPYFQHLSCGSLSPPRSSLRQTQSQCRRLPLPAGHHLPPAA
jgi:transposase